MASEILSKYVIPGSKVDIREEIKKENEGKIESEIRVYSSQVYDVLAEDRIEIAMPMKKAKLIVLSIDREYTLSFYTDTSIYQCRAKVVDRTKRNNVYLLTMQVIGKLSKEQRREYFRFSCALQVDIRELEPLEIEALERKIKKEEFVIPDLPYKKGVIVDISGGGLRFISDFKYDVNSVLLCKYQLDGDKGMKVYDLLGKVLHVKAMENREGTFECRVQYINIDKETREEIIKFIFGEERKILRKKGDDQ